MSVEQRIDDLIEAGWRVLDSNFDPVAFQLWRRRAFDCLTAMAGPDHVYTQHFERFVRQEGEADLLIAAGILTAAKEQASGSRLGPVKANGNVAPVALTEKSEAPLIGELYRDKWARSLIVEIRPNANV